MNTSTETVRLAWSVGIGLSLIATIPACSRTRSAGDRSHYPDLERCKDTVTDVKRFFANADLALVDGCVVPGPLNVPHYAAPVEDLEVLALWLSPRGAVEGIAVHQIEADLRHLSDEASSRLTEEVRTKEHIALKYYLPPPRTHWTPRHLEDLADDPRWLFTSETLKIQADSPEPAVSTEHAHETVEPVPAAEPVEPPAPAPTSCTSGPALVRKSLIALDQGDGWATMHAASGASCSRKKLRVDFEIDTTDGKEHSGSTYRYATTLSKLTVGDDIPLFLPGTDERPISTGKWKVVSISAIKVYDTLLFLRFDRPVELIPGGEPRDRVAFQLARGSYVLMR